MTLQRTAAAFALFTALTAPTWALADDVPPVVAAILKSMEAQTKVKPTYKSITGDATNATIEGLEIKLTQDKGSMDFTTGKIELKNVVDKGNGLYEVGEANYGDMKWEVGSPTEKMTVTMPTIHVEGWFLKSAADNPTPADRFRQAMYTAKKATTGTITLTASGQTITSDGIEMTWDGDPVTGAGKSNGKIKNIVVPETALAMMDPTGTLKSLGYSSLTFDLGGEGTITNDGTNFGMDGNTFVSGKDVGTLKFGLAFSGLPLSTFATLAETKPGQQPDMSAIMPQLMGAQFGRLSLRFEDASITKKILPLVAQMQGMDEATFVANATAMAQLGLAQLKNPDFTNQAVAAIGNFLKEPKSFTISAQPPAPLPVMQLMAVDPNNLGAAIQQLGITVKAND